MVGSRSRGGAWGIPLFAVSAAAATVCWLPPKAVARPAQQGTNSVRPAFASLIPPEANFYLEVRRLSELEATFQRTRAATILPLLVGRPAPVGDMADFRKTVAALTGVTQPAQLEKLMSCEAAYCASSWRDLEGAVLLIRLGEESWLGEWFPPSRRNAAEKKDKTLTFETAALKVAARDRLVAICHKNAAAPMFARVAALMQEKKPAGWASDPSFKKLCSALPLRPLLLVGLRRPPAEPIGAGEPREWNLGFDVALLAIDDHDGQVDLDFHARAKSVVAGEELSRPAREVLQRLPGTTLMAWATTADWREGLNAWSRGEGHWASRWLSLVNETLPLRPVIENLEAKVGRRAVAVWGRALPARPSVPQLAVFLECEDARGAASALTQALATLIPPAAEAVALETRHRIGETTVEEPVDETNAGAAEPKPAGVLDEANVGAVERAQRQVAGTVEGAAPGLVLRLGDQLGTPLTILEWPTDRGATNAAVTEPTAAGASALSPSFAPVEGWLVVALSEDHLRSVIESHRTPRTEQAGQRGLRDLLNRPSRSGDIATAQPALAASVVTRWLADHQAGRESPFDASAWLGPPGRALLPRLGVAVEFDGPGGVARITDVPAEAPSADRLAVEDWILGVDGQLLTLENTGGDLRRRLVNSHRAMGPMLRVNRGGEFLDIEIPSKPGASGDPLERMIPMLRQLALIGQRIEFAAFHTWDAPPDQYGAHLSVRFNPPPNAPQSVPAIAPAK
ncbi:MAG: hypothetical protein IT449_06575 [Phycisphaerales bacterium]|nr:hypothetical protein [Phycisphaerales bacterium]